MIRLSTLVIAAVFSCSAFAAGEKCENKKRCEGKEKCEKCMHSEGKKEQHQCKDEVGGKACHADVEKICGKDSLKDHTTIHACLDANAAKLSTECKKHLEVEKNMHDHHGAAHGEMHGKK